MMEFNAFLIDTVLKQIEKFQGGLLACSFQETVGCDLSKAIDSVRAKVKRQFRWRLRCAIYALAVALGVGVIFLTYVKNWQHSPVSLLSMLISSITFGILAIVIMSFDQIYLSRSREGDGAAFYFWRFLIDIAGKIGTIPDKVPDSSPDTYMQFGIDVEQIAKEVVERGDNPPRIMSPRV